MEAERRRSRVRKPLADCTNTIAADAASSQSSSSSSLRLKPQKPLFSSAIKKLLPNTETKSTKITTKPQKVPSSTTQNDVASQQRVSLLPPPVVSTPSRPPKSSSDSGRGDSEVFEPCSVYSRRQTAEKRQGKMASTEELLDDTVIAEKRKSKGKAIAEPMSCPPATKIQKIGEKVKEEGGNKLSKTSTVPSRKKQGRPPSQKDAAEHALSQEFINQQRAYFKELDDFKLLEEEVESVAELD